MRRETAELWARTALLLWPDELMLASFAPSDLPRVVAVAAPLLRGFCALVVERDEVSLTIARREWSGVELEMRPRSVAGPFRAITFDLPIELTVCGYLLPAAERLAAAGISIVPQCGYQKDHVLVDSGHADDAMAVLKRLIDDACALAGK
jgi:hypothetical protein